MRAFEKEKIMYGEDYQRQDDPWKLWEFAALGQSKYEPLGCDPAWFPEFKYRRKLKKVTINGVELVAPETEALDEDTPYWVASIIATEWAVQYTWGGDELDLLWLERGLVFLEKDHAAAYAKAKWEAKEMPSDKVVIPKRFLRADTNTALKWVVLYFMDGSEAMVSASQCETEK